MLTISNDTLESICKQISSKIKVCPKCGKERKVVAIFENNENDDIIGWVQFCPNCDNDTDVPILSIEELDWK